MEEKPLAPLRSTKSAPRARPEVNRPTSFQRFCSVARTVEILSDPWSFLVLRECFFGTRRFEKFQSMLGLSRTTLAKLLKKLSALGLLRKEHYSSRPPRFEYRFADKGRELYPVMLTLLKFGDKWLCGESPPPHAALSPGMRPLLLSPGGLLPLRHRDSFLARCTTGMVPGPAAIPWRRTGSRSSPGLRSCHPGTGPPLLGGQDPADSWGTNGPF